MAILEPLRPLILGETDQALECVDATESLRVAVALIEQTERELDIFSRDLEPAVYDTEECAEALLGLILRNRRYSRIRLLIQDPARVAQRGHRLLELGMRLSSHVLMRKPAEEDCAQAQTYLIADRVGVLYREHPGRLRASANFCDPSWAGDLARRFDRMWENAQPDEYLRRLML